MEATLFQKIFFILIKKMPIWLKNTIRVKYLLEKDFLKKNI